MRHLIATIVLTACGGADFEAGPPGASDGGADPIALADGAKEQPGRDAPLGVSTGDSGPVRPAPGAPSADAVAPHPEPDATAPSFADGGDLPAPVPACPAPQLGPEDMPTTFAWEEWRYQKGPECVQCSASPCVTCELGWFPVEQDGTTVSAALNFTGCPMMQVDAGPCGAEYPECAWWRLAVSANLTFELEPTDTGWRAVAPDGYASGSVGSADRGMCGDAAVIFDPAHIAETVAADVFAAIEQLSWECPPAE